MDPLILKFNETINIINDNLDSGDLHAAHERYVELFAIYEQINESPLQIYHKEIAYDQIIKIRAELESVDEPKKAVHAPLFILVGLLLLFGSYLAMTDPTIVGLTFLEQPLGQTDLGLTFEQSAQDSIVLDHVPTSLRVSGQLSAGEAKVYAWINDEKLLVFDSTAVDLSDGTFAHVCQDTCVISTNSQTIPLEVEVTGGALFLQSASYTTEESANNAPEWTGSELTYELTDRLSIDLQNLFFDADGDSIVYLVTSANGVQATVTGSQVEFVKTTGTGDREVTLIASDLKDITRQPITLRLS
jgi:hypothetical protein